MGQTLSEPVTTKETDKLENSYYRVGSSCMQGWRISILSNCRADMEDAHTHLLSMPEDPSAAFFAVYDGHGGARVAQYAGENLHKKITVQSEYWKGDLITALKHGFLATDSAMLLDDSMKDDLSGATAVSVLIKDNKIYCANVGDSRAITSVGGVCHDLSHDHKPADEGETRRIIAAGGWVEFNRVNGNLALSRALGDFLFKRNDQKPPEEQIISACPDVIIEELTPDHEFIVLACDGIWDVLTNQEVIDFVRIRIGQEMQPEIICEELMSRCLAPDCQMGGVGCDNMTVVLVCVLHGHLTYKQLVAKCAKPRRHSFDAVIDEKKD